MFQMYSNLENAGLKRGLKKVFFPHFILIYRQYCPQKTGLLFQLYFVFYFAEHDLITHFAPPLCVPLLPCFISHWSHLFLCLTRPLGSALISFCPEHQSITSNLVCHLSPIPSMRNTFPSAGPSSLLPSFISSSQPALSYFPIFYFLLALILERQTILILFFQFKSFEKLFC